MVEPDEHYRTLAGTGAASFGSRERLCPQPPMDQICAVEKSEKQDEPVVSGLCVEQTDSRT